MKKMYYEKIIYYYARKYVVYKKPTIYSANKRIFEKKDHLLHVSVRECAYAICTSKSHSSEGYLVHILSVD